MVKVGVVGYGVIGQRLADGVAKQEDMELIGIVDVAPTLSIRALYDSPSPYDLYVVDDSMKAGFEAENIPVKGDFDDILSRVDIILDASPGGIGAKNKEIYKKKELKAIFQGGEKNEVADVFFHGYANYPKGVGADYMKLTSCNTTGFIRAVDCIDRAVGVERVAVTIIRRAADPGDIHRGLIDVAQVEPVPNHQALDLMLIMPHIDATGALVHVPTTHGHIITLLVTPKKDISIEQALEQFEAHPRIKVVDIAKGFNSNTALFRYARDKGNKRADMYEIAVFREMVAKSGDNLFFTINVPQEAVVIPESIDAIRAAIPMQKDGAEAVALTNKYLGIK
ncbi:MAG: type II glyceraldehyde-3-phosphate dehydrogenase [Actinomycetota bacterium]|nr:MAG: type II glyceraldehyde-3-phosphate dehydrogenase [Actinomycetota bacterium]